MTMNLETIGTVLHVQVFGKLTTGDYELLVPAVDQMTSVHGSARLLFDLHDFHGWTAGAMWSDLKFGVRHLKQVRRIAVVGAKAWIHGLAIFCKPFIAARIQFFDKDELERAQSWVAEGSAPLDFSTFPTEVGSLLKLMGGDDGIKRQQARSELVSMGPAITSHLARAARDGAHQLRLEATRALSAIGDPAAANALADQCADTFEIGWAAAEGLSKLSCTGATAALNKLIEDPCSPGVCVSVHHALRCMKDETVRAATADVLPAIDGHEPMLEAPVAAAAALDRLRTKGIERDS